MVLCRNKNIHNEFTIISIAKERVSFFSNYVLQILLYLNVLLNAVANLLHSFGSFNFELLVHSMPETRLTNLNVIIICKT